MSGPYANFDTANGGTGELVVEESNDHSNFQNVHYNTSTNKLYRSPSQLGKVLFYEVTANEILPSYVFNGYVIYIKAGPVTLNLPPPQIGYNCVIINSTSHSCTLDGQGVSININQTTFSLQTSKRIHHLYGHSEFVVPFAFNNWFID
jgi:hypothetical protein